MEAAATTAAWQVRAGRARLGYWRNGREPVGRQDGKLSLARLWLSAVGPVWDRTVLWHRRRQRCVCKGEGWYKGIGVQGCGFRLLLVTARLRGARRPLVGRAGKNGFGVVECQICPWSFLTSFRYLFTNIGHCVGHGSFPVLLFYESLWNLLSECWRILPLTH